MSLRSGFTPGPWIPRETSHGSHTEITKDGNPIAVAFNGVFEDCSTGESNAFLIARAPEMAELLREIYKNPWVIDMEGIPEKIEKLLKEIDG